MAATPASLDEQFYQAADSFFPANHTTGLTYDDVSLALLAYNWGPSRLRELLAQGRDPRNGYASTIMSGYQGTW